MHTLPDVIHLATELETILRTGAPVTSDLTLIREGLKLVRVSLDTHRAIRAEQVEQEGYLSALRADELVRVLLHSAHGIHAQLAVFIPDPLLVQAWRDHTVRFRDIYSGLEL